MKLGAYLALGRVSNLPTVWSNGLVGAQLSGAELSPVSGATLLLSLSGFYVGGMFLNDVFDRNVDQRIHPERPIPSGRVSAKEAACVGAGLLGLGEVGLAATAYLTHCSALPALVCGGALGALIVLYDAWHKGNPIGPLLMGGCRMLVYFSAALAASGALPSPVLLGGVVLLCYLIGLTYIAKQETLTRFRHGWPLAFLAVPFGYIVWQWPSRSLVALLLYVFFLGWVISALVLLRERKPGNIPRAVVRLIAGISVLDALLLTVRPSPAAAGIAAAGLPLTLLLQRYVRGT